MSVTCIPSTSYFATPEFLVRSVHVITAISFPIHLLGLYIILLKTPKAMSSIKWYFVNVHTWIVIYDNSLGVLTIPYLLLPSMGGCSLGLLSYLGVSEFLMVVLVLLTCANMQLSILAVFENRFFIICEFPGKHYWEKYRWYWLAAHYFYAAVVFIPMWFLMPDQEEAKKRVLEKLVCVSDYVRHSKIFTLSEDWTYHLGTLGFLLIVGVIEGAVFIIYLLFYIIHQVKTRKTSRITLKLQIKFLIALLIQMLVPVVMMVIPLAYSAIVIVYDYYNQAYMNIAVALETMHGLFSTLTMIFIHHPYRIAFFQMLPEYVRRMTERRYREQRVSSVVTTQT